MSVIQYVHTLPAPTVACTLAEVVHVNTTYTSLIGVPRNWTNHLATCRSPVVVDHEDLVDECRHALSAARVVCFPVNCYVVLGWCDDLLYPAQSNVPYRHAVASLMM